MDILATFGTDEQLELEGKWFPLSKTSEILVARSGNENYVKALRAEMKATQLELSSGEEADQLAEEVLIKVMSETVLLGWKGIKEHGKDVPYTPGKAREYLRLKDFRKKVASLSDSFEAFRRKAEEAQGNA